MLFQGPHHLNTWIPNDQREIQVAGVVKSVPSLYHRRVRFDLQCSALKKEKRWSPVTGALHLSVFGHPILHVGDRIMVEGNYTPLPTRSLLRSGRSSAYLQRRGVSGKLTVNAYHGLLLLEKQQSSTFFQKMFSFRRNALNILHEKLPKTQGAVLGAMLLGDRSGLDRNLWDLFARTGASHLLAISGLHVGVLAGLIYWLCSFLRFHRKSAFYVTCFLLSGYAFLVGGSPPVIRASMMILLFLLGNFLGRKTTPFNILLFVFFSMLFWNPYYLFAPGFQLSFLAVFSILFAVRQFKGFLDQRGEKSLYGGLFQYVKNLAFISLWIWIGMWPLVAYHFHIVSPISCLSNVVVVPLLFPIIGVGITWLMLHPLIPPASTGLLGIENILLSILMGTLRKFDAVPYGSFQFFPNLISVISYYLILFLVFLIKTHFQRGREGK